MIRLLAWLLGGLLLSLAVLLLGSYTFSPQLLSWLGPVIVHDSPFQVLEVTVDRPGMSSMNISRLRLASDELILDGQDLQVSYQFRRLLQGQFDSLLIDRLDVVFRSDNTAVDSATARPPSGETTPVSLPDPGSLFALMPFAEVRVPDLTLRLPELAFVASGELRLDQESLQGSLAASSPEEARDFRLDLQLDRAGEIHAVFGRAEAPDAPFLSLHSQIPDDQLHLAAEIHLEGSNMELAALLLGLPKGQGSFHGNLTIEHPWPLGAPVLPEMFTVLGTASIDWVAEDGRLSLSRFGGPLKLVGGLLEWTFSQGQRALVNWRSDGVGIVLAMRELRLSLPEQRLSTEGDVEIQLTTADGEPAKGAPPPAGSFAGAGTVTVEIDDAATGVQVELEGELTTQEREFPVLLGLNAQMTDVLHADLELTSGIVKELGAHLHYSFPDGAWALEAAHELRVSEPLFAALWPGWEQPFEFESGKIGLLVSLAGTAEMDLTGSLRMELSDMGGFYNNAVIRGLRGVLNGRYQAAQLEILPSPLAVRLLDFGVPLSDIDSQLSGNLDSLVFAETRGDLLGGRFLLQPFSYEPSQGNAEMMLELKDLDLAAVLALEGEDITGTGRLDGMIPISIRQNQVVVEGGEVQARPPGGSIHLSTAVAGALAQPGLDVALGAMTNFQYEVLTAKADYSSAGDLQLGIRLEGRSPLVEKGRPIHFNLNVSENVPVLLESLRLQDAFTKRIERKVLR